MNEAISRNEKTEWELLATLTPPVFEVYIAEAGTYLATIYNDCRLQLAQLSTLHFDNQARGR